MLLFYALATVFQLYHIPCSFLLWNLGEPRKLFLMVCSRVRQGTDCMDGEPGGVEMGGSTGRPRTEGEGELSGEAAGLVVCRLFLRLKKAPGFVGVLQPGNM